MTYDEFDEYVKQSEPHKKQRGIAWQTAIGLQDVDGLKTSEYMLQTAQKHIEGDITIQQAKQLVDSYYESKESRAPDNDSFAENSWYFRNALVRANYADIRNGISYTSEYLERFFRNLLMNEHNELKNRYLLTGQSPFPKDIQSAENGALSDSLDPENDSKCQSDTLKSKTGSLKCNLIEWAVVQFIEKNPKATQKEIALQIYTSERTVKRITASLASDERGILKRINGKRDGWWEVRGAEHK
jgi:hypothetical protein